MSVRCEGGGGLLPQPRVHRFQVLSGRVATSASGPQVTGPFWEGATPASGPQVPGPFWEGVLQPLVPGPLQGRRYPLILSLVLAKVLPHVIPGGGPGGTP